MATVIWTPFDAMLTQMAREHLRGQTPPSASQFRLILCNASTFTSGSDMAAVLQSELLNLNGYARANAVFTDGTYDATQKRHEQVANCSFSASGAALFYDRAVLLSDAPTTASKPVVSMTASNDQIQVTGHSLVVGDRVLFTGAGTIATGLANNTIYFVQAVVDANNIKVAATSGGAAIDLTADSSGALDLRYANGNLELFAAFTGAQQIADGQSTPLDVYFNLGGSTSDVSAA